MDALSTSPCNNENEEGWDEVRSKHSCSKHPGVMEGRKKSFFPTLVDCCAIVMRTVRGVNVVREVVVLELPDVTSVGVVTLGASIPPHPLGFDPSARL